MENDSADSELIRQIMQVNAEVSRQAIAIIKDVQIQIQSNPKCLNNPRMEVDEGDNNDAVENGPTTVDDERAEQQNDDCAETKTRDVHKGLPMGRVKLIMKTDPDVNIVAGDALFVLTKATESFVALLAQHCHKEMESSNKKTLQKKHVDAVIENNVPFEFLEGALDW